MVRRFACLDLVMHSITYKVSLGILPCSKAPNSPIFGNGKGNTACLERELKEHSRATPAHGQDNECQLQHLKGIRSGTPSNTGAQYEDSSLYVVVDNQGIPAEQCKIITIKRWADLKAGHRGLSLRNSGFPKGRKTHGNGGVIVAANSSKLIRSYESTRKAKDTSLIKRYLSIPTGLDKVKQLVKENQTNTKKLNQGIMKMISDVEILKLAYMKIKSKPGKMTKGTDDMTLDGIDLKYFTDLAIMLGSGRYQPTPVRRVMIPKPSGGERPLGIPSPRDKIVEEAIRLILDSIFEPSFLDCSHGFRPGKSCHSALKDIKLRFGATVWFIEGEISKSYDSIDHHVLAKLLSTRIEDKGFFDLYWKFVKAGYVFQGKRHPTDLGTPQGSVVSPLLSNIYLHELDVWMIDRIRNFNIGERRRQSPLYTKMTRVKGGAKEARRLGLPTRDPIDNHFKRLRYVRYADDFIIGIIGSKSDAENLIKDIKDFLKENLKLDLSLSKTKLTHASSEKAYFLGTWIKVIPVSGFQIKKDQKGNVIRVSSRPQLRIPLKKIVDHLVEKGIVDRKRITPTRVGRLLPYTMDQIVEYYNKIYRGLANYYSFVDDYSLIQRIHFILKISCALTLASKLKLKTKHKVFQKFGKNLTIQENNKVITSFTEYELNKNRKRFHDANHDPLTALDWYFNTRSGRINPLDEKVCALCGSREQIEIHHLKHLRKMGKFTRSDAISKIMVNINRKQIPVCKPCHNKIHHGKHDRPNLKTFPSV